MTAKKTNKELRKFGITMAVPLAIIASLLLWKDHDTYKYFYGAAGFFLLFALVYPKVLWPIEWVWMKFAFYMGIVMSYVLLTITFYVVITPVGFLMRLFGNDPMKRKLEPDKESYWIEVDPEGPTSRPDKPY